MPFKSRAQHRLFRLLERRGELDPGTTAAWLAETHAGLAKLPETVAARRKTAELPVMARAQNHRVAVTKTPGMAARIQNTLPRSGGVQMPIDPTKMRIAGPAPAPQPPPLPGPIATAFPALAGVGTQRVGSAPGAPRATASPGLPKTQLVVDPAATPARKSAADTIFNRLFTGLLRRPGTVVTAPRSFGDIVDGVRPRTMSTPGPIRPIYGRAAGLAAAGGGVYGANRLGNALFAQDPAAYAASVNGPVNDANVRAARVEARHAHELDAWQRPAREAANIAANTAPPLSVGPLGAPDLLFGPRSSLPLRAGGGPALPAAPAPDSAPTLVAPPPDPTPGVNAGSAQIPAPGPLRRSPVATAADTAVAAAASRPHVPSSGDGGSTNGGVNPWLLGGGAAGLAALYYLLSQRRGEQDRAREPYPMQPYPMQPYPMQPYPMTPRTIIMQ